MHLITPVIAKPVRVAAFLAVLLLAGFIALNVSSSASAATAGTNISTAGTAYKSCGKGTSLANLPMLRIGDSGPCVRYLQEHLLKHEVMIGTSGPDGQFGPGTLSGVKNFQKWNKVPGGVDGIVGANTWKSLMKEYVNPVYGDPVPDSPSC